MPKTIDLLKYQSPIIQQIREFKAIANVENTKHEAVWQAVEDAINDQFANTLTDNGCKRWESIMQIEKKDTDDISFRRFRILSRLNEQLPYTYRVLALQLRTLCGEGEYSMELQNEDYTLVVKVALSAKDEYNDVSATLRRYVPANIVIDLSLLYNTYEMIEPFTYEDLETITYQDIREEVLPDVDTN